MSIREPEAVNETWTAIFRYDFGVLAIGSSLITFALVVIWLYMSPFDGLGSRESVLTIGYFNWHPFMMSMAFLVFMVPGVLSFEILPFARDTNKSLHGLFNLLALLAAFAGFAIILDCHNNLTSIGSFHTVHGCIGLVVLIALAINYLGGFFLYVVKLGGTLRSTLKPLHKRLGLSVILLGLANIALGVFEQELKKSLKSTVHQISNAIGVMAAITIIGVIFTIVKFMDKKDDDSIKYTPITENKHTTPNYGTENRV